MIKSIKDKLDPKNCDDATLVKRTVRVDKVISVGAGCTLFGGIVSVLGLVSCLCVAAGSMPFIVPLTIFVAGASAVAGGIPLTGWANSTCIDYIAECKQRQICPPGPHWYPHQFITSPPPTLRAVEIPSVAKVFDPAAAVTLDGPVKTMPTIRLNTRKGAAP